MTTREEAEAALDDFNEQIEDLIGINECRFDRKTIEVIRSVLAMIIHQP